MKNNSKYTKIKEQWLDIYNSCKTKLYQFNRKIISIIFDSQNNEIITPLKVLKRLSVELTIIDKYILKSFFYSFLAVISVLLLVIVGRLFVKLLDYVVEGRFDIEMVFSLLLLSSTKSLILLLPFAIMIGLLISLSRLYRDSEIYALKASGNYKNTFTKIFYLIATPSFLIIFLLNIFASPYLITEIQKKKIEAASTSEIGLTNPGKFIQMKDKDWIIFVDAVENNLSKRIFIKSSENNKISIETAEEASEFIDKGTRSLVLKNGQRYTGTPGTGNFQVMKYDRHEVKLLNTSPDFSQNYRMKSIFNLMIDQNKTQSSAEIQWRLFAPISVIILILFAFIFGDVPPRKNKYSNLLLGIIVYFIYSNLAIVSVNQIQKGSILFLFIGTWWVHISAALICYILYIMKKNQLNNYTDLLLFIRSLAKKLKL